MTFAPQPYAASPEKVRTHTGSATPNGIPLDMYPCKPAVRDEVLEG